MKMFQLKKNKSVIRNELKIAQCNHSRVSIL